MTTITVVQNGVLVNSNIRVGMTWIKAASILDREGEKAAAIKLLRMAAEGPLDLRDANNLLDCIRDTRECTQREYSLVGNIASYL